MVPTVLPVLLHASTTPEKSSADHCTSLPKGLEECQSPMTRWFDGPASFMMNDEPGVPDRASLASPAPHVADAGECPPVYGLVQAPLEQFPHASHTLATSPASIIEDTRNSYAKTSCSPPGSPACGQAEAKHLNSSQIPLTEAALRRQRRHRAAKHRGTVALMDAAGRPTDSDCINPGFRAPHVDALPSHLRAGGQQQSKALAELRGAVRRLTFDVAGCRVVQLALEVTDRQTAAEIVVELHGFVLAAIESPHGNYVIQKLVQVVPTCASFVADEIQECCIDVVRHRYGCRIVCRLVEHLGSERSTLSIVDEVARHAKELCIHCFGHHVVESILKHGRQEHQHKIALTLRDNFSSTARHRYGSYVIESAFQSCVSTDQSLLSSAMLGDPKELVALAENQYGLHVVRTMMEHDVEARRVVHRFLNQADARLFANTNLQQILR